MKYAPQKRFIDREPYAIAQCIAWVLLTIGLDGLKGTQNILAVFSAGACLWPSGGHGSLSKRSNFTGLSATVAWDGHFETQTEKSVFSSAGHSFILALSYPLNLTTHLRSSFSLLEPIFNEMLFPNTIAQHYSLAPSTFFFLPLLAFRCIPSLFLLYRWIWCLSEGTSFHRSHWPHGVSIIIFIRQLSLQFLLPKFSCRSWSHISTLVLSRLTKPRKPP
ncbi:hypothetical protein K439DRAFT_1077635 [Ramaria rubella]|nr:hypothetical protein K439DRAFT_1077635 [Ramaria rubella]